MIAETLGNIELAEEIKGLKSQNLLAITCETNSVLSFQNDIRGLGHIQPNSQIVTSRCSL